jgi:hypothetical protein
MTSSLDSFDFDTIEWETDDLSNYLQYVTVKDEQGMYLIHHAVRNNASLDFIKRIIAVLPDGIILKDKSMRLPLHYASQMNVNEEILDYLVNQYSKGLRERDHVGMLPLHYLVGSTTSLKILALFERHYPESLREKDREGWLPLHHAARRNSSVEVLEFLVLKYPGGLAEGTYHGSWPIHCSAYYNHSLEVNRYIVKQNPRGLKEGGTNGMKPIHSAARNNTLDVVTFYLNEYPLGIHCLDNQERLPIHYGIKNPQALSIVRYLLNLYPDLIRKVDGNGWLPLHCAARSSDSLDLISFLVRLYPEALKAQDNSHWLPIFHSAKYNNSFIILQYLYEQFPESILMRIPSSTSSSSSSSVDDELFCHEIAPVASNHRNFLGLHFMAMDTGNSNELGSGITSSSTLGTNGVMYNEIIRIHIVGDHQSGKTTIHNNMKEIFLESFNIGGIFDKGIESSNLLKSANLGVTYNNLINNTSNSSNIQDPSNYTTTVKVKSSLKDSNRIINKISSDRYVHYLLYDYGGLSSYHSNYSSFLSFPNSLYVIVLPLYDKINKQKYNLDYLLERMFYWLKYLYSVGSSVMMNHNGNKGAGGGGGGKGGKKPKIPLALILNTFATESKVSNDEVTTIRHILYSEAKSLYSLLSMDDFLSIFDVSYERGKEYLSSNCDFILIGESGGKNGGNSEFLASDLSIKQNNRKLAEYLKRASSLLHLPISSSSSSSFSPYNSSFLMDSSAPFFGSFSHSLSHINPFFNVVRESKLISYCWDVLALLDFSLVMMEDDFKLLLTSTIRTFFHKMLNYKDYKIKEALQTIIEKQLYNYLVNYFIFIGKILFIKRKKTVLSSPLNTNRTVIAPPPSPLVPSIPPLAPLGEKKMSSSSIAEEGEEDSGKKPEKEGTGDGNNSHEKKEKGSSRHKEEFDPKIEHLMNMEDERDEENDDEEGEDEDNKEKEDNNNEDDYDEEMETEIPDPNDMSKEDLNENRSTPRKDRNDTPSSDLNRSLSSPALPPPPPPPVPVVPPPVPPTAYDEEEGEEEEAEEEEDDGSSIGDAVSDDDHHHHNHRGNNHKHSSYFHYDYVSSSTQSSSSSHSHSSSSYDGGDDSEYEYLVVTSPHLLMNNVLDVMVDKLIMEIRHNKRQLLLEGKELESWFREVTNKQSLPISILELLISLKVALPVFYDETTNAQMIRFYHQSDIEGAGIEGLGAGGGLGGGGGGGKGSSSSSSTATAVASLTSQQLSSLKHQHYWLYQLTSDKIPLQLNINYEFIATINNYNHLHSTDLLPMITREVSRLFYLTSLKENFFPSFFTPLYDFILYKIPNILHFNIYQDGLLVISKDIGIVILPYDHLPSPSSSSSSSSAGKKGNSSSSASYQQQSSPYVENSSNGFIIKIVSSLVIDVQNKNNYHNDLIWNLLNDIRYFISSQFWNFTFQEYCLHSSLVSSFPSSSASATSSSSSSSSADADSEVLPPPPSVAISSASSLSSLTFADLIPVEELERKWFSKNSLTNRENEIYLGIISSSSSSSSSSDDLLNQKLIYLMRSSLSSSSSKGRLSSEKIENIISRALLSSKYELLFDNSLLSSTSSSTSMVSSDSSAVADVLSLENMNEMTKEYIVQLILDSKRPSSSASSSNECSSSSTTTKLSYFHRNPTHLLTASALSYFTILTKNELLSLMNRSLTLFHDLRKMTLNDDSSSSSSSSSFPNHYVKRIHDFPPIPILSYHYDHSSNLTEDGEGEGKKGSGNDINDIISEEIIIPNDRMMLTSRFTVASSQQQKENEEKDKQFEKKKKATANHRYIRSFRVCFLCPVCGKKAPSGKDDYSGYLLTIFNQWSTNLLEMFVMTIKMFIYLTNIRQLANNNNTIPELAYLLQDTIEILLSQLDKQFNPYLLSPPNYGSPSVSSDGVSPSIHPLLLYQLQKKIFYIMKNYSLKSFQSIKKLKDSLLSITKLPKLPSFVSPSSSSLPSSASSHGGDSDNLVITSTSATMLPSSSSTILSQAAANAEKKKGTWLFGYGGDPSPSIVSSSSSSASKNTAVINTTEHVQRISIGGTNLGSNIGNILNEEDIASITTSTSFSSVINDLFKFTSSKDYSSSIVTEELEKLLSLIPINGDAYMNLLKNFFVVLNDEYLLHTGLMRVENKRGEVAWVCPPVLSPAPLLSSNLTSNDSSPSPTIADFNWNYQYKRDNPRFKSSCAEEFLERGSRCLMYRFQEY